MKSLGPFKPITYIGGKLLTKVLCYVGSRVFTFKVKEVKVLSARVNLLYTRQHQQLEIGLMCSILKVQKRNT